MIEGIVIATTLFSTAAAGGAVAAAGAASLSFLGLSAVTWSAIGIGVSIAGTLAQTLLAPQPPKPKFEDGSQSVKQAVPPRVRCYGRFRLGGAYIYFRSTDEGDLKTLVCHAAHQVAGIDEHWLNDEVVTLDSNGKVNSGVYNDYDPILPVTVRNYLGTPTQVITGLDDGEWTAGHDGRGLCCTYVNFSDMKPELQQKVFPSGAPAYRATLRGALIYDPRIAGPVAYAWSDNAALVILDYLTRTESGVPVGFGLAMSRINLDAFKAAADVCDQVIARKPHTPPYPSEKRYRAWGAYELTEDRKSVLADLLDACCGRLTQGPDGRLGLTVGAPGPVVAVTVTDDQVLEYDFSTGKAAIERVNEVRATYVSADQDWAETEAGIQLDQAAIDRNGVESSQIKLRFVPSEGQAQRIARFTLKRGNPSWSGKIRGTLALLDAWGERWVRLQLAELAIDQVFEVTGMRLDRATMAVEMEVTSYDGWWDWNPATDEADPAPIPDDGHEEDDVPVPTGVTVSIEHRPINGQSYAAFGVVRWAAPPRPVFVGQVRYRPVTVPPAAWQFLAAEQDELTASAGPLIDNQGYEAQVRFLAPRGSVSKWSASATFTAIADPTAPAAPTSLTAMVNGLVVDLSVRAGNSNNQAAIRFWRNTSNSFSGAVDVSGSRVTGANQLATYTDAPGPGDWWYFATAENWSGVRSAAVGGVLAEPPPAQPTISTPSGSTTDTTPTVTGTAYPGSTVRLYDNAVANATGAAHPTTGAWSIDMATLALGNHTVTATATVAGNQSAPSGSITITVTA